MSHNFSKGIAMFTALMIIFATIGLSIFLFTWLFKYHITLYIASSSLKSKSSLIPLVLLSSDFKKEKLVVAINEGDDSLEPQIRQIMSMYTTGNMRRIPIFCYKLKIGSDVDVKTQEDDYLVCERRSFYRVIYPFPQIFNGDSFITSFEFATFKAIRGEQ